VLHGYQQVLSGHPRFWLELRNQLWANETEAARGQDGADDVVDRASLKMQLKSAASGKSREWAALSSFALTPDALNRQSATRWLAPMASFFCSKGELCGL